MPSAAKVARVVVEQALRQDPDIGETRERRVNAAGRMQKKVVLRLAVAAIAESADTQMRTQERTTGEWSWS
jgi:hypothetical protein